MFRAQLMVSFNYDPTCNHFMLFMFPSLSLVDVWISFVYLVLHSLFVFHMRHKSAPLYKDLKYFQITNLIPM